MTKRASAVCLSQGEQIGLSLVTMHLLLAPLFFLLPSASVANAHADPGPPKGNDAAEALARGDHKLVISLLSPPPLAGPDTCVLAEALLLDKEEGRSLLYWNRCHQFEADADVRRTMARLKKSLRKKSLAPVSLALRPASAAARVDKGYGKEDLLLNDEDLWLPSGTYQIQVSAEGFEDAAFKIEVESSDRMLIPLSLEKKASVTATEIDLGEDAGAELGSVATAADPRPKKFKTLLAERYRRAPDPKLVADDDHDDGDSLLWPAVSAAGGLALVGTGLAFHLRDQKTAAFVGYGAGASLIGVATYLLLRDDDPADKSMASVSIGSEAIRFTLGGRW